MKYRKKPVVIEAIQFDGENFDECIELMGSTNYSIEPDSDDDFGGIFTPSSIIIHTLEGDMKVSLDDYIIKGVNGEYYPCKPDIFEKTYEKVEEE